MNYILIIAMTAGIALPAFGTAQPPAEVAPGKCLVQGLTPPVFEEQQQRVLVKPSYKTYEVVPGIYKTVDYRILTKPAETKYVYHPAEYERVLENIAVKVPSSIIEVDAPTFDTVFEALLAKPAVTVWEYKRKAEDCLDADPRACLVWRQVEKPAAYKNIPVMRLRTAAGFRSAMVPEDSTMVETSRIVRPARVEEITIPAEYLTVQKQELVSDAIVRQVEVPAEYRIENVLVLRDPGGTPVWEEVDCRLTEYALLPIAFAPGSAELSPSARAIIDKELLPLAQRYPMLQVEIAAHTDVRGEPGANLQRSQRRAETVVQYLVQKGIPAEQLIARGFGDTRLKNHCAKGVHCAEWEHAQNRRVEYRLVPYMPN